MHLGLIVISSVLFPSSDQDAYTTGKPRNLNNITYQDKKFMTKEFLQEDLISHYFLSLCHGSYESLTEKFRL